MGKNNKGQKASLKNVNEFFHDPVTKRKIEKHLSDINDTISDEDIKNVITNITSDNPNINTDNSPAKKINTESEEVKQIPTSWNLID